MASWDGLENSDSEEVCGACGLRGLDLSVGLQKVNYVLLRGSFCHQQSRLTVLGGKKQTFQNTAVTFLNHTVAVLFWAKHIL